jgi:hypothetical protein
MEIIKKGKHPKDRVFEANCWICRTEFRFFNMREKLLMIGETVIMCGLNALPVTLMLLWI